MNSTEVKGKQSVINMILSSLKIDSKKGLYIFLTFSLAIGLGIFLLAWKLAPWYYAINTPVSVYLDAPADTNINICWDKAQSQCLPLVPYSTTKNKLAASGEIANLWISELPPRPAYVLSLIFKSSLKKVIFHELVLDSSKTLLFGYVREVGIINLHFSGDEFVSNRMSSTLVDGLYYLDGGKGGRLTLGREIYPGPSNVSKDELTTRTIVWVLLFSVFLLVAIYLYLLPRTMLNLSSAMKMVQIPKYSRWTFIFFGSAMIAMLLLVVNSGALFTEYDPLNYLQLALSGRWFSDTRLPGYPFFLSLALWVSGYHLNGVILLQAIILASSVMFCVWTLKRWIPQFAAIIFVILCLFSPAQIHWARWILRESLFTSLVLLAVTATIAHFTSRKPVSNIWLFVFSIICGLAFLVRENGIILPIVLLPVLVPQMIKLLLSSGTIWERARSALLLAARYAVPVAFVGIIYIGFSTYNYLHYGYFQIGIHQTSHSFLAKAIYPGNSDARGLLNPGYAVDRESKPYLGLPLYKSFILARYQTPGLDPVYMSLYPYVSKHLSEGGEPRNTFHLASMLNKIGSGMNSLVPWQADLAGILRQYSDFNSYDRVLSQADKKRIRNGLRPGITESPSNKNKV